MPENEEHLIPPAFAIEILKNSVLLSVSDMLAADSCFPHFDEFLTDPVAYRLKHPYVPPTRKQRIKTWIGAKREKLGEKLYSFVAGLPFPGDSW